MFTKAMSKIYLHRWYFGILLLIVCVFFELHCSSIGNYSTMLHTPDTVVWGQDRPIRGDEWIVNTPFAFSQYYTNFSYWSDIVRGTKTDMFMVYGQPVHDWNVILRPSHWGYLFLSPSRGLSFFWMSRLIFLFLISLEFGLLICKKIKLLALIYAASLTFAPLTQWWFAVNSLPEILIFGQLGVLLLVAYLHTNSYKCRFLYSIGLAWVLAAYIFAIYPAWQVTCAYVFLIVAVWSCYDCKNNIRIGKVDFLFIIFILVCLSGFVVPVLQKSWTTIQTVKATVYPGSRLSLTGNLHGLDLFNYALGLWLPNNNLTGFTNNCEVARIFDLAPLGFLMALLYFWKQREKDILLCLLVALQVAFVGWGFISWPAWFARMTLMSNVTHRVILGIGLINIMLLVRVLALGKNEPSRRYIRVIVSVVGAFIGIYSAYKYYPDIFNYTYIFVTFIILFTLWLLALEKNIKILALVIVLVVFYAGCRVNPISRGIASIYQSPTVNRIINMAKNDKGLWLVYCDGGAYNNIPIMAGAPTINSVNVYPVLDRWEEIDKAKKYYNIYNRYAHIAVFFDNQEPKFKLHGLDYFEVHINQNDLMTLKIKHILSTKKLEIFSNNQVKFEQVFDDKGLFIYNVKY